MFSPSYLMHYIYPYFTSSCRHRKSYLQKEPRDAIFGSHGSDSDEFQLIPRSLHCLLSWSRDRDPAFGCVRMRERNHVEPPWTTSVGKVKESSNGALQWWITMFRPISIHVSWINHGCCFVITFLAIPKHPRHVSTVQGYPTPLRTHPWSPPGCPCRQTQMQRYVQDRYAVCIAKLRTWTPAIQIRKIQEVQFIQRFGPKNGPFSQYTDVLWIYDQCCGSTPILISSLPCRFTMLDWNPTQSYPCHCQPQPW